MSTAVAEQGRVEGVEGVQAGAQAETTTVTTTGADGQAESKKKVRYPGLDDGQKLSVIPEDYDDEAHLVLREEDFTDGKCDVYYEWQAERYDESAEKAKETVQKHIEKAADFRARAVAYRETGSFQDRQAASKMVAMQMELDRLAAQIAAQEGEGGAEKVKAVLSKTVAAG